MYRITKNLPEIKNIVVHISSVSRREFSSAITLNTLNLLDKPAFIK